MKVRFRRATKGFPEAFEQCLQRIANGTTGFLDNLMNIKRNSNLSHVTFCKVCEKSPAQPWLIAKGFRVGRCTRCGFAQVLDIPSADTLSQLYETLHTKHIKYRSSKSARLENIRRLKFLQQQISNGARVLDAGCATGDFLAEAAERSRYMVLTFHLQR